MAICGWQRKAGSIATTAIPFALIAASAATSTAWRATSSGRSPRTRTATCGSRRSAAAWPAGIDAPIRFQQFRHDPAKPDSLSSDAVRTLLIDADGRIWVGTEQGLDLLDPQDRRRTALPSRRRRFALARGRRRVRAVCGPRRPNVGRHRCRLEPLRACHRRFRQLRRRCERRRLHRRAHPCHSSRTTRARCGSARSAAASIASIRDTGRVTSFRHDPAVARSLSNDRVQRSAWKTMPSACGWRRAMASISSIALPGSSFATAATRTIRRACATTTSWRCTRIAAACCGSARATAAPVTGIRTAGCSATIAALVRRRRSRDTRSRRTARARCGSELRPASSRSTRAPAASGVTGATARPLATARRPRHVVAATIVTARCGSAR